MPAEERWGRKEITSPSPREIPDRRWGSIATDFITHLPRTNREYNAIITYMDRIYRMVHFIPCKYSNTAEDVAEELLNI